MSRLPPARTRVAHDPALAELVMAHFAPLGLAEPLSAQIDPPGTKPTGWEARHVGGSHAAGTVAPPKFAPKRPWLGGGQ